MRRECKEDYPFLKPTFQERRFTEVSPSKKYSLCEGRMTNTAFNGKARRNLFDDDVLPKLELFISHTNKLSPGSPIRGKHIFFAKPEFRQSQHYPSPPKNYREYIKTHKSKKLRKSPGDSLFRY